MPTEPIKRTQKPIEFWFDFASNYSYLSVMRIEILAQTYGVKIHWRPFLLGPIFKSLGWTTSPFVLQKQKGNYVWIDIQRRAKKYGIAWNKPTQFPRSGLLPMRIAAANMNEPWIAEYCRKMMQLNFVVDQEIDSLEVVQTVLTALNLDAAQIIHDATSEPNKSLLRIQTETAIAKEIFGAPMFIVGEELFWGDDRLEDAIACALA